MKSCTLYGVDGDFLPLVDELVANGTFVTVVGFSNPKQGQVVPSLRNRADRYLRINNLSVLHAFDGGAGLETLKVETSRIKKLRFEDHDAISGEKLRLTKDGSLRVDRIFIDDPSGDPQRGAYTQLKGFSSIEQVEL